MSISKCTSLVIALFIGISEQADSEEVVYKSTFTEHIPFLTYKHMIPYNPANKTYSPQSLYDLHNSLPKDGTREMVEKLTQILCKKGIKVTKDIGEMQESDAAFYNLLKKELNLPSSKTHLEVRNHFVGLLNKYGEYIYCGGGIWNTQFYNYLVLFFIAEDPDYWQFFYEVMLVILFPDYSETPKQKLTKFDANKVYQIPGDENGPFTIADVIVYTMDAELSKKLANRPGHSQELSSRIMDFHNNDYYEWYHDWYVDWREVYGLKTYPELIAEQK